VCTDESHPSCVILVEPATWLRPAKFSRPTEVRVGMGWGPKSETERSFNPTRVMAGQRHATDPTRFLLTAEERGTRRVVEAWLNDDGSAVYFEIREGAVP
jgi:hypothetical protein